MPDQGQDQDLVVVVVGQVAALGQAAVGQGPMAGVVVVVVGQGAALGQVRDLVQVGLGQLVALMMVQQPAAWAAQAALALRLARAAQHQQQRQGLRSRSPWVCAPSAAACSCCSVARQRVLLGSNGWCVRQTCPAASG
jgi:hypothetical protein